MTIKAYHVTDNAENSEIVFSENRAKAIHKSEALKWAGDWTVMRARRVKWADEYAGNGEVPLQAMLDHGWRLECETCHTQTNDIVLIKDDAEIRRGYEIMCADCAEEDE